MTLTNEPSTNPQNTSLESGIAFPSQGFLRSDDGKKLIIATKFLQNDVDNLLRNLLHTCSGIMIKNLKHFTSLNFNDDKIFNEFNNYKYIFGLPEDIALSKDELLNAQNTILKTKEYKNIYNFINNLSTNYFYTNKNSLGFLLDKVNDLSIRVKSLGKEVSRKVKSENNKSNLNELFSDQLWATETTVKSPKNPSSYNAVTLLEILNESIKRCNYNAISDFLNNYKKLSNEEINQLDPQQIDIRLLKNQFEYCEILFDLTEKEISKRIAVTTSSDSCLSKNSVYKNVFDLFRAFEKESLNPSDKYSLQPEVTIALEKVDSASNSISIFNKIKDANLSNLHIKNYDLLVFFQETLPINKDEEENLKNIKGIFSKINAFLYNTNALTENRYKEAHAIADSYLYYNDLTSKIINGEKLIDIGTVFVREDESGELLDSIALKNIIPLHQAITNAQQIHLPMLDLNEFRVLKDFAEKIEPKKYIKEILTYEPNITKLSEDSFFITHPIKLYNELIKHIIKTGSQDVVENDFGIIVSTKDKTLKNILNENCKSTYKHDLSKSKESDLVPFLKISKIENKKTGISFRVSPISDISNHISLFKSLFDGDKVSSKRVGTENIITIETDSPNRTEILNSLENAFYREKTKANKGFSL